METCIVIPDEFSLVLTLHPNPKNILEMNVALWSNTTLSVGSRFSPDDGKVRLDRLEVYSYLDKEDLRNQYGSQDTIATVEDREVRHCNWVRFLKYSTCLDDVNIVGIKVKDEIVFQTVKTILPNEEIVAFLEDTEKEHGGETKTAAAFLETQTVKHEPDDNERTSVPSSTTRDLLTSPLSRDDDCKSSVSDGAQSEEETEPMDQESSPQTSSTERYSEPEISPDLSRSAALSSSLYHTPSPEPFSPGTSPVTSPDSALDLSSPRTSLTSPPTSYSLGRSPAALDLTSPRSASSTTLTDYTLTPPSRDVPPRPKRNRERTWLPCEVCGKKFDRPSLLKRHMRTHTGEKPHACDVCGKAFSTSSSLNTHRRIHSGEKPHQCGVCGKRFTASSNLYYHRMTHSKEKPHKCKLCEKSFPTPGDLRSHMYVHDGSWPFRCDVCNRGFSKQTNLKNHLLLHTGDKPHECPVCQKKFALHCNLKTHLKTHEEDDQGSCIDCGRTYLKKDDVISSQCSDCLRNSSPASSPGSRRHLSDFSISKLTQSDGSGKSYRNSHVKQNEIYDSRLNMFNSVYSPVHFANSQGGHCYSSQDRLPFGYIPVYSGLSPEAQSSQVGRLVPSYSQGLSLADAVYQSSRAAMLNGWPGLMAK